MKIRVDYDRHPDSTNAEQLITDVDTGKIVSPDSLIGKHVERVYMERGMLIIELQ